jgi:hypothetical protein
MWMSLFNELVELGQHPKEKADTITIMGEIGHFLDEANDDLVLPTQGRRAIQKTSHRGNLKTT